LDVACRAAWGVEAVPQRVPDLRRALGATQRHDRATEPGARESCARRARLPGQIHQPVQLGVAHLVVVPQTLVRRVEQLPERRVRQAEAAMAAQDLAASAWRTRVPSVTTWRNR